MPLSYTVPESKRLRVIVDTDAACEADDPFAIAQALLSRKFEVKGICATHFGSPGSVQRSHEEVMTVLKAMDMSVPVFMGEDGPLSHTRALDPSPAARFIVEEARLEDAKPLFVLCLGAITNVARAFELAPAIAGRMTVIWIGGHGYEVKEPNHREFNAGNDVPAANVVFSSGGNVWQVPNNVYGTMHLSLAEIERRIAPCGAIGKHLFDQMIAYNHSPYAGWTAGESWSLGDNPAVGLALEPNCGQHIMREAPLLNEDTSYRFEPGRPLIRVYTSINSRFILEDLMCKLELCYGKM